jgi:lipoprotein-releasing system permease protein
MLPFRLAIRFLKSGRGQTILVIMGIAVAISAQIFVGLIITSLQKTLINSTMGRSPHITIKSTSDVGTIKNWELIVSRINQTGLARVVSVCDSGNAIVEKDKKNSPALIRGFDRETADKIYDIRGSIYEGVWNPSTREALVGKDLKEELDYKLGDNIFVRTPDGSTSSYKISGFFDFGVAELNKTWIIVSFAAARDLFGYGDRITSIEITVDDLFQADAIAGQLNTEIQNNTVKIDNWKDQNQQLLSGLQGQNVSSLMIQIFIVVSVVIAIASILAITVFQKSRQIGILKAMGIKDRTASSIFIIEGFLLGLMGSLIGVALGLALVYSFSYFTTKPGSPPIIDLYIDYNFIALSWGISLSASVLAGLIPARRSLRLNPVDVIREG